MGNMTRLSISPEAWLAIALETQVVIALDS